MAKYSRLSDFLQECSEDEFFISFHEVENILGFSLPNSAFKYPAWWSNNVNNGRHCMAWISVGWRTSDLNLIGKSVSFVRDRNNSSVKRTIPRFNRSSKTIAKVPKEQERLKTSNVFVETDIKLNVSWKEAGEINLDKSNKLVFPPAPKKPGLYRLRIQNSHYIGETVNIRRRFQNYRNPGVKQQTNLRINAAIFKALCSGKTVFVDVISDEVMISTRGVETNFNLSSKSTRRFIENGILLREESEEIENLNR